MAKSSISTVFKVLKTTVKKHGPEILTGIGIAGMATAAIMVAPATIKAIDLKKKAEKKKGRKLTTKETVKECWKPYVPAAVTGVGSAACLVGASASNIRRNAALVSAYKLSENTLNEYSKKVADIVGEDVEKNIKETVVREQVSNIQPENYEIVRTQHGDTLFYDELCGRFFTSDRNFIDRVVNLLNRRMRTEMYMSLNEFYTELDLDSVDLGDYLGWNIDSGYIEVDFGSDLADSGTPYVTMHHVLRPKCDYDKL